MARLFNNCLVDSSTSAKRKHGGTGRKPPIRLATAMDGDHEGDRDPIGSLRDSILAACNGCENTLQLFLQIADEEVPSGKLGRELNKNRGEAYRWAQRGLVRIRKTLTLADAAVLALDRDSSGFTLDPHNAVAIPMHDAWAVSLQYEQRLPRRPGHTEITYYIAAHFDSLFRRNDRYFGGWHDEENGEWCLDVTKLFPPEAQEAALRFARLHRQKAITHLRTLETVRVEKKKRRAA